MHRTVMTDFPALLQLAEAAFPAGGFGHSFGLETAIVEGSVTDAGTLEVWIRAMLLNGSASSDGAAMTLLMRDTPVAALDARLTAAQPNAEIRLANAHLARATLDTYVAMGIEDVRIAQYAKAIGERSCSGVHALAAAIGYRAIGAGIDTALQAHASTLVASYASVAARAVPLGQRSVARARWNLHETIAAYARRAQMAQSLDDLSSSAVHAEIDGLRHRRLPARLFAS
jgi:urease accessory protein